MYLLSTFFDYNLRIRTLTMIRILNLNIYLISNFLLYFFKKYPLKHICLCNIANQKYIHREHLQTTSFLSLFHPVTLFVPVKRTNLQFYQIRKKEIDTSKYRKSYILAHFFKKYMTPICNLISLTVVFESRF